MRYLLYLLGVMILSLGAFAAAGYVVIRLDPEDRLDMARIVFAPDVISKKKLVSIIPHDALLLGSSRMMEVSPKDVQGVQAYNAGMGGATPERIRDFLEAFAQPDSTAVIEFDFFMWNEAHTPLERNWFVDSAADSAPAAGNQESHHEQAIETWVARFIPSSYGQQIFSERNYVFNLGTLARALAGQSAVRTGGGNTNAEPLTYPDGQIFNESKLKLHEACLNPPGCIERARQLTEAALEGHFGRFVYSETRVHTMEQIRTILRQRNIRYVVLIGPEHEVFLPALMSDRLAPFFQRFKSDVRRIFPDACDFADGSYANPANYYSWDPFHYLPKTGARLINQCITTKGWSH
ncbi:MAG: hypothetical protein QM773_00445 [Hyphomonadaceae bacterium]